MDEDVGAEEAAEAVGEIGARAEIGHEVNEDGVKDGHDDVDRRVGDGLADDPGGGRVEMIVTFSVEDDEDLAPPIEPPHLCERLEMERSPGHARPSYLREVEKAGTILEAEGLQRANVGRLTG